MSCRLLFISEIEERFWDITWVNRRKTLSFLWFPISLPSSSFFSSTFFYSLSIFPDVVVMIPLIIEDLQLFFLKLFYLLYLRLASLFTFWERLCSKNHVQMLLWMAGTGTARLVLFFSFHFLFFLSSPLLSSSLLSCLLLPLFYIDQSAILTIISSTYYWHYFNLYSSYFDSFWLLLSFSERDEKKRKKHMT